MSNYYDILLIEDDLQLADLTVDFLNQHQFTVTHAADGTHGLQACERESFDLIICDIMLPDISGFQLVEKIKNKTNCPVLFLTAINTDEDQIRGLELGAVDYLVKPVNPKILLARMNNILFQLSGKQQNQLITIDNLVLDRATGKCLLKDSEISLTQSEFELLWLLASQIGQPVSRELLFKETVGREYDGLDRTIDGRVSRLRKKLEQVEDSDFTIRTIWSKGYQLCQLI